MKNFTPLYKVSAYALRERVRVRGERWIYRYFCPLIRPLATFSFRPYGSSGRRDSQRKINTNQEK